MMKIFSRQNFIDIVDRDSARTYSDIEFRYCRFESCDISVTRNPKKRTTVQRMIFKGCEVRGCSINPALIEDVLVSSLKTHNLLISKGAVYKHVKLEGNIGRILISPLVSPGWSIPEQVSFDEINTKFYQSIDWALDISEGRFEELDIRGIPGKLVKRDPETQVIVSKEKALLGNWKKLDLSKTYWATAIQFLLDHNDPDIVLVAPKRSSKFPALLDGIRMLRDAGVTEPD